MLECIHIDKDLGREQMMFRVMFNTSFIRSNILMLGKDDIDTLWDAKDRFTKDFRAEVSNIRNIKCLAQISRLHIWSGWITFVLLFTRYFLLIWRVQSPRAVLLRC